MNSLGLDISHFSFNLVKKAFATRRLAFLATSITFYDILARACAEITILRRESYLRLFVLILFPAFPFSFLFAAVIDLLLGLLAVKKLLRKRDRDGQFLPWSNHVLWQEILLRGIHSAI